MLCDLCYGETQKAREASEMKDHIALFLLGFERREGSDS